MALDSNMVIPAHVALILDGNGRWAKKRGLPRTFGHKEGCVTVEKTVEIAARMGIKYLTVYGFSTENWKRSEEEVGALMQLFRYYMVRLLKIASANNVRVKMIGDRRRFAQDIIDGINRLEEETKDNTGLTFVIAVNYGGRDEIRRAAAKLAEEGIDAKVINIHTIKPLDEELVVAAAKETGKVVTVEEHSIIGGLGGAVAETLSRRCPTRQAYVGIQDCFGESGKAGDLLKKYGLTAEAIVDACLLA